MPTEHTQMLAYLGGEIKNNLKKKDYSDPSV